MTDATTPVGTLDLPVPPVGQRIDRLLSGSRLSATMPWILGVMIALATLAAGAGLAGGAAAVQLRGALSTRLTVQVIEGDPARRSAASVRALALLQGDAGVRTAELVPEERVRELIAPYLGTDRLDPDLPVPGLIDVTLVPEAVPTAPDRLTQALETLPARIRIDRTEDWAAPVRRFLTLIAGLALTVLALTVAATTAAVVLAARAALDAHGTTIATLHLLGATDRQVARLFERRVGRDGLFGIAGGFALGLVLLFAGAARVSKLSEGFTPGGDGAGAGPAGVPAVVWVAIATIVVPLSALALTRLSTRWTVLRTLRAMR